MEINSIRCTLILLVILIHCTPFKDAYPAMQNAILAFVVPLFLFIAMLYALLVMLVSSAEVIFVCCRYTVSVGL